MPTVRLSAPRAVAMSSQSRAITNSRRRFITALTQDLSADRAILLASNVARRTTVAWCSETYDKSPSKSTDAQNDEWALASRKKVKEKKKRPKKHRNRPNKDKAKGVERERERAKDGEASQEKEDVKKSAKIRPGQSSLSLLAQSDQKRLEKMDTLNRDDGKKR